MEIKITLESLEFPRCIIIKFKWKRIHLALNQGELTKIYDSLKKSYSVPKIHIISGRSFTQMAFLMAITQRLIMSLFATYQH